MQRYAVGEWESLWANEPYMKHRFVLDLESRTVIAGEDRVRRHWRSMRLEHIAYMQQILDEIRWALMLRLQEHPSIRVVCLLDPMRLLIMPTR